jgi:predicted TIM-barrel fold metal-dependent hydrolase
MFHSGGTPGSPGWDSSRPVWIAEAAFHFPDVKMIIAHVGGDWWNEAIMACKMLANVFVDLSSWQLLYKRNKQKFYEWLRDLIDEIGIDRILWGTDGPTLHSVVPLKDWVIAFTEISKNTYISQDEIDAIMYKNSQHVYGIK